jgi:hypothetical protein
VYILGYGGSLMETRRINIVEEIIKLTPLCSGALYEQYIPCGKKNCRCHDKENPKLHGPYFVWVRRIDGKQVNRTLCPGPELEKVKEGIENYSRFQVLLGELLRRDEASVLSADRAVKDEGKKNSRRIYRRH